MRFAVLVIIALSTFGWLTGFSEAAATLPNEPIKEQPTSIVIPRDIPLEISDQEKALKGIRIVAFGDSGTGDEGQMKVARAMENFKMSPQGLRKYLYKLHTSPFPLFLLLSVLLIGHQLVD